MTAKELFIKEIEDLIEGNPLSEKAAEYFENLKLKKEKAEITETGMKIIKFMQEHQDKDSFLAKTIGEGLFLSSRSVSGSIRKLVEDGYCTKEGKDPVHYSLSDKGKNQKIWLIKKIMI